MLAFADHGLHILSLQRCLPWLIAVSTAPGQPLQACHTSNGHVEGAKQIWSVTGYQSSLCTCCGQEQSECVCEHWRPCGALEAMSRVHSEHDATALIRTQ